MQQHSAAVQYGLCRQISPRGAGCFGLLGGCRRKLANVKKNPPGVRFAHQSDVHEVVVLLSLGVLVVWTIGPFVVFIVYHVPPLRRFLGLDDPIK